MNATPVRPPYRWARSARHADAAPIARRGAGAVRALRRLVTAGLAGVLGLTALALPPAAAAQAPAERRPVAAGATSPAGSYIVRAAPGRLDELVRVLARRAVTVERRIGIIDAVVVRVPAAVVCVAGERRPRGP